MKNKLFITFILIFINSAENFSQNPEWIVFDSTNSELPINYIARIATDKQDNVWFLSRGYLNNKYIEYLGKYEKGNWHFLYPDSNSNLFFKNPSELKIDKLNNIWIADNDYSIGLLKFDGTDWKSYRFNDTSMFDWNIYIDLAIDSSNQIWCATIEGLSMLDINNIWHFFSPPVYNDVLPHINNIAIDKYNNIWFSVYLAGLYFFNGSKFVNFNITNSSLITDWIEHIVIDKFNNIWFANLSLQFESSRLLRYNGNDFIIYNKDSLNNISDYLIPRYADDSGNVWFTGFKIDGGIPKSKGLVKYNGLVWELFDTLNSGLPSNNVYCVADDSFGNVWIGTDKGLAVYNKSGISLNVEYNLLAKKISIYPNPVSDENNINIIFQLKQYSVVSFEIYNSFGNRIYSVNTDYYDSGIHTIPVTLPDEISSGTYWAVVAINGARQAVPFVIVR